MGPQVRVPVCLVRVNRLAKSSLGTSESRTETPKPKGELLCGSTFLNFSQIVLCHRILFISITNREYILQQREISTFAGYRLPSPLHNPPVVLFRAAGQSSGYNRPLRGDLDLVSRGPDRLLSRQAFNDYLSWRHVDTPIIPFTRSWNKVLNRRQRLIEEGRKDVIIIAIWSRGLRNVYDAYEVAK